MVRHDMGGPIPENLDLPAYCTLRGIALQLIRMKVKAVTMIDRDTQALPMVAHQVAKGSRFSFVSFQGLFCLTMDSRNVHGIHTCHVLTGKSVFVVTSDAGLGENTTGSMSMDEVPTEWKNQQASPDSPRDLWHV
ncbi:hypothetical protein BGZ52_010306 [Haplosporangium bisporale]|nr:hypothetical protein BGZ52_010306 [Haplosporangium bisporale]